MVLAQAVLCTPSANADGETVCLADFANGLLASLTGQQPQRGAAPAVAHHVVAIPVFGAGAPGAPTQNSQDGGPARRVRPRTDENSDRSSANVSSQYERGDTASAAAAAAAGAAADAAAQPDIFERLSAAGYRHDGPRNSDGSPMCQIQ